MKSLKRKLAAFALGIIFALIILELGLRCVGFGFSWMQSRANAPEKKPAGRSRIMCVGESTTALGGRDSYPRQLETVLNQQAGFEKFEVFNKGIPGTDSSVIMARLEKNLDLYKPDIVVSMMGANDTFFGGSMLPYDGVPAIEKVGFPHGLKIYKLARIIMHNLFKKDTPAPRPAAEHLHPVWALLQACHRAFTSNGGMRALIRLSIQRAAGGLWLGWSAPLMEHVYCLTIGERALAGNPWQYEDFWGYQVYFLLIRSYEYLGLNDTVETMLKDVLESRPADELLLRHMGLFYEKTGNPEQAAAYFERADDVGKNYFSPMRWRNYRRMKELLASRGIKLVCVQYPRRSVEALKQLFASTEAMVFVDNQAAFEQALKREGYEAIFTDRSYADFGHCTRKGNRILAENVAAAILNEYVLPEKANHAE